MIRPGVDFAFTAGADDIARTILLVAKKRSAAMHPFLLVRLRGVERRLRSLWVSRDPAFVHKCLVIIGTIPIAAPFPHVSSHVVQAIAVWWKGFHRRDAGITVFACIFHRECSLPRVSHPFAAGSQFITPNVGFS